MTRPPWLDHDARRRSRTLERGRIFAPWYGLPVGLRDTAAGAFQSLPASLHRSVPVEVRRAIRHQLGKYYAWEQGFDFTAAPPLEPGEVDGPPDFVGIGVQKAGTSWWFRLITDHPEVSTLNSSPGRQAPHALDKERHFFGRFGGQPFGPDDVSVYRRWFPRRPGTITGEWTPDYFFHPWVPPLLAQAAPDAKLIVLLRDPLQRFRSRQASSGRDDRIGHVGNSFARAIGHSLYADSARRWLDCFPSEQLLFLQYEQCVADPAEQLGRTYRHLGIADDHRPEGLRRPVNQSRGKALELDPDVTERLRAIFAPDVAALADLLPSLDLSLWTGLHDAH